MATLAALAELSGGRLIHAPNPELVVEAVGLNAQELPEGGLFAGVPGTRVHGASFADSSAAAAVLTDEEGAALVTRSDLPIIVVDNVRAVLGPVSAAVYGDPSASLTVIGITGTSGKTTTSYMVESALLHAGKSTGLIGTTGTRINGVVVPTKLTTPEAPNLQALFARMLEEGVTHVVMEVSSHAIALGRVAGTHFAVAGFTNLSQDHLDFHPTMEDYFLTKAQLFLPSSDLHAQQAVICVDDEWGQRLYRMLAAGAGVSGGTAGTAGTENTVNTGSTVNTAGTAGTESIAGTAGTENTAGAGGTENTESTANTTNTTNIANTAAAAESEEWTPEHTAPGKTLLAAPVAVATAAERGGITPALWASESEVSDNGMQHTKLHVPYASESARGGAGAEGMGTGVSSQHGVIKKDLADATLSLPMPGRFNIANALLALGLLGAVGIDTNASLEGLHSVRVPGRLERVDGGQQFLAAVDYAHKPGAIAAVLDTLRAHIRGRLAIVVGAGGDRDSGKRPKMGREAALRSDLVIVTDDNPRSEDPAAIRQAVLAGAREAAAELESTGSTGSTGKAVPEIREIEDRRQAIRAAVAWAQPGDAIVIAGKGHETGQLIGDEMHPFDDRIVTREAIRDLVKCSSERAGKAQQAEHTEQTEQTEQANTSEHSERELDQ